MIIRVRRSFELLLRVLGVLCGRSLPFIALLAARHAMSDDSSPLPDVDISDFTSIFDGQSLGDWDGDSKYWKVEDGKLVGTVTPETLLKQNSWIVWRGGLVEDFELVLDYRISAEGNSGVGY